jgi:predicted nuclease with TOPRIM domain
LSRAAEDFDAKLNGEGKEKMQSVAAENSAQKEEIDALKQKVLELEQVRRRLSDEIAVATLHEVRELPPPMRSTCADGAWYGAGT